MSSNGSLCEDCVRKRNRGHKNAKDAKYCNRHQCPIKLPGAIVCTIRKKASERRCNFHATCKVNDCHHATISDETDIPNDYCASHTCMIEGCVDGKVYHPSQNHYSDLCAAHTLKICTFPSCFDWKVDRGDFCKAHTCISKDCDEKTVDEHRPYCMEHNRCNIPECVEERCQSGDQFENVCMAHYIPPCRLCSKKSSRHSEYCDLHSCRYKGCPEDARPALGKPFCTKHRCHDDGCQLLRNFSDVDGVLRVNTFCFYHECNSIECTHHSAPDKPFCAAHCCTNPVCNQSRDGDPRFGTLCFGHHKEGIEQKARAKAVDELASRLRLEKLENERAAQATAEEVERQSRSRPKTRDDPEIRQEYSYHNLRYERPGKESKDYAAHEYDWHHYEDEGYRSNRNSDSHKSSQRYPSTQGHPSRGW